MTLDLGQSFFTPESSYVPRHLWIVVSNPQADQVVIVNFSSWPTPRAATDPDPPCDVQAAEHPDLSKDSYVRCDKARLVQPQDLERLLGSKTLSPAKQAPPALVTKLQRALGESKETPTEIKTLLRAQGYIPP